MVNRFPFIVKLEFGSSGFKQELIAGMDTIALCEIRSEGSGFLEMNGVNIYGRNSRDFSLDAFSKVRKVPINMKSKFGFRSGNQETSKIENRLNECSYFGSGVRSWLRVPIIFMLGLVIAYPLTSLRAMPFESRLSIGSVGGDTMVAGEAASWTLEFFDSMTGRRHVNFFPMHQKYMHLIVVKSDLSSFAHVHPYLDVATGQFTLEMNTVLADPDNVATQAAVPDAGKYYYFNEVVPIPENERMPMVFGRGEFYAIEPPQDSFIRQGDLMESSLADDYQEPVRSRLEFEKTADLSIYINLSMENELSKSVKYYHADGSGGEIGAKYKVIFSYEQFLFCNTWMPKFYIRVLERGNDSQEVAGISYQGASDFQKYLGMGGHSIIISEFGGDISSKVFYHLHGFLPMSEKGKFIFPYDNHKQGLPDGRYRVWSQVKRQDVVLTFENVIDYVNPPIEFRSFCFSPRQS